MAYQYKDEINGDWKEFKDVDYCLDCLNGRESLAAEKEIKERWHEELMSQYWIDDPDSKEAGFKNFIYLG
ncbi:hypothetical protein [Metabacillus sp. RGM 3146]|uniref:hypothetical protein n=1 Tax=Metabacillus sp. RGM 3146 TaxID=3401092 RepID=UPI003B9A519C